MNNKLNPKHAVMILCLNTSLELLVPFFTCRPYPLTHLSN